MNFTTLEETPCLPKPVSEVARQLRAIEARTRELDDLADLCEALADAVEKERHLLVNPARNAITLPPLLAYAPRLRP